MAQPIRAFLALVHVLGAIWWFGGMMFAYFCLRPAAAESLDPPERLTLWTAAFDRFLRYTSIAVVLLVFSGFTLLVETGWRNAPKGRLVMTGLGLLMTLVYGQVYLVLFPRLRDQSRLSAWPAAAIELNKIRRFVGINLLLAAGAVVAAVMARH